MRVGGKFFETGKFICDFLQRFFVLNFKGNLSCSIIPQSLTSKNFHYFIPNSKNLNPYNQAHFLKLFFIFIFNYRPQKLKKFPSHIYSKANTLNKSR